MSLFLCSAQLDVVVVVISVRFESATIAVTLQLYRGGVCVQSYWALLGPIQPYWALLSLTVSFIAFAD